MKAEGYSVAVVGATGAVGREVGAILRQRQFPLRELKLFASERSFGETAEVGSQRQPVDLLGDGSFDGVDLAFFCAGPEVTEQFAGVAVEAGAVVIDTSGSFLHDDDVPLVVPEVNAPLVDGFVERRMVASPASPSVLLSVALRPMDTAATVTRVVVSSYQSASGQGRRGIDDLSRQTVALMGGQRATGEGSVFPRRIAFNCIPQVGELAEDGQSSEETRIRQETRRILGRMDLPLAVTCVQVPVFFAHCLAVWLETRVRMEIDEARAMLREAPGLVFCDRETELSYPTAADVAGADAIYVGRLRRDESCEGGMLMWVAADNVRKGGALNAVQIAEILVRDHL